MIRRLVMDSMNLCSSCSRKPRRRHVTVWVFGFRLYHYTRRIRKSDM